MSRLVTPSRPAGRELDAEVAAKVMGWRLTTPDESSFGQPYWTGEPRGNRDPSGLKHPPAFSTDIALAWKVLERMADLGHTDWQVDHDSSGYFVLFSRLRPGCTHSEAESSCGCWEWIQRDAETAPLAICLAALATLESDS